MSKSITLFPHEARAAAAGTLRQLWRPMKVQPPADFEGTSARIALATHSPIRPGDVLACRKTWQEFFEDEIPAGRPVGPEGKMGSAANPHRKSCIVYRADGEMPDHPIFGEALWESPATMPAWAVRSWIKPVSVAVKRVQEMSMEDAKGWGFSWTGEPGIYGDGCVDPLLNCEEEWNFRFARRGLGWDKNPWCWSCTVEQAGRSEAL